MRRRRPRRGAWRRRACDGCVARRGIMETNQENAMNRVIFLRAATGRRRRSTGAFGSR